MRLQASRSFQDQALVFVHGYNNRFDDALFRTAQIAYDLKYDGAPFLYSWPSGSGIAGYPFDSNSAQQAEQYFRQFLMMVVKETGAKSVSIIAHSMGNQLLLETLRNLDRSDPEITRINQIILAAPDVDRDSFGFLAQQLKGVGQGITMYASSNDRRSASRAALAAAHAPATCLMVSGRSSLPASTPSMFPRCRRNTFP